MYPHLLLIHPGRGRKGYQPRKKEGREGEGERERKGEREGGRERGREEGREGEREGEREWEKGRKRME